MNITLQGTNLDLTEGLRSYVDEKLRDAFRAFGDMDLEPVEVAVELEVTTHHHRKDKQLYRAEVTVSIPGRMLRAEATADDMYQAITQVKHTLMREIRQWRERLIDGKRQGARRATAVPETADKPEEPEEMWEAWDEDVPEEAPGDDVWDDLEELGEDERDYI